MKSKIISGIIMISLIMIVGCEIYGYEDKWETDRRLCNKCTLNCGWEKVDKAMDITMECIPNCVNNNYITEENHSYCSDLCFNIYDNEPDVIEYQECYQENCKWVCD